MKRATGALVTYGQACTCPADMCTGEDGTCRLCARIDPELPCPRESAELAAEVIR